MFVLLAFVLAVVFAIKNMFAAMTLCIVIGAVIHILGRMSD